MTGRLEHSQALMETIAHEQSYLRSDFRAAPRVMPVVVGCDLDRNINGIVVPLPDLASNADVECEMLR
jgi:hypothetical protein